MAAFLQEGSIDRKIYRRYVSKKALVGEFEAVRGHLRKRRRQVSQSKTLRNPVGAHRDLSSSVAALLLLVLLLPEPSTPRNDKILVGFQSVVILRSNL